MACALNQAQAMALRNRPVGPGMDLARPRSLHARRLATTKVVNKDAARKQQSLFAKLGGAPAVNAAVELFYDKMLADPRISYFFDGIDMRKQRAHQAAFLTYAMGGSKKYEGNANMSTAHARLAREMDMRMEHFDIVVEHLGASLQDLNVPQDDISEAAVLMETLRPAFQEAIDNAHK